ncbi:hypothetical protein HKX48_008026 [Thoreauomyces humboldtii]|nr:hypothetical protein HKX48_008026 [Thoreauomyces humboldtii]
MSKIIKGLEGQLVDVTNAKPFVPETAELHVQAANVPDSTAGKTRPQQRRRGKEKEQTAVSQSTVGREAKAPKAKSRGRPARTQASRPNPPDVDAGLATPLPLPAPDPSPAPQKSTQSRPVRLPVARPQPRGLEARLEITTDPADRAKLLCEADLATIERRFSASGYSLVLTNAVQTVVRANLVPTDPDFPFELEGLELEIALPTSYPMIPCTIRVLNESIPASLRRNVEKAWTKKATASKLLILPMINWLDSQLEALLIESAEPPAKITFINNERHQRGVSVPERELSMGVVPSGPESDSATSSEEDFSEGNDEEEDSDPGEVVNQTSTSLSQQHKGIHIRLPNAGLENIALLQCMSLNIVVRCTKCKQSNDVKNLVPSDSPAPRWVTCLQCGMALGIRFRSSPLHSTSLSIGYLDLEQCSAQDLLPSNYVATCDQCFKVQSSAHAFKSVIRGYPITMTCIAGCHAKMTLRLEDARFVNLAPTGLHNSGLTLKKRKKPRDDFTLVVGTPLPKNGICRHYKHSYRYFRFPCCGKLYPCDVCHQDEVAGGHEMTWANRVVCGFCSREANFQSTVTTCACGKDLVRVKHKGGFWEGGKGTRNRNKMSRNDPRKFAGLSKTASQKQSRVGKKHDG